MSRRCVTIVRMPWLALFVKVSFVNVRLRLSGLSSHLDWIRSGCKLICHPDCMEKICTPCRPSIKDRSNSPFSVLDISIVRFLEVERFFSINTSFEYVSPRLSSFFIVPIRFPKQVESRKVGLNTNYWTYKRNSYSTNSLRTKTRRSPGRSQRSSSIWPMTSSACRPWSPRMRFMRIRKMSRASSKWVSASYPRRSNRNRP